MGWMDSRPEAVTPGVQIGRIGVPILLAHGSLDRRIPASKLDCLASAANPALVTWRLVDGSGHRTLLKSTELARRLPGFLNSALGTSIEQPETLTRVAQLRLDLRLGGATMSAGPVARRVSAQRTDSITDETSDSLGGT
jgi:pimeloyl-ACP methyl ester carboxylesterase